jgi:hypothetical protein
MNLESPLPGRPFEGDYPPPGPATEAEEEAIRRQSDALERLVTDLEWRAQVLADVQQRRLGHPDLRRIVDLGDNPRPGAGLHVAGEILVDRTAYDGRDEIRSLTGGRRMARQELGCEALDGSLVRLVAVDPDPALLVDTVGQLRQRNAAAALNYVLPLSPVGKSGDTPEPAPGLGNYAAYPVPEGGPDPQVGVIDTGITTQTRSDGWLAGVAAVSDRDPLDVLPFPGDGKLDGAAGHGTHVAGIVQQVAPGVKIRVYQALATDGFGSDLAVACAMLRAVQDGCKILNLSLGGPAVNGVPPIAMAAAVTSIPPDVAIVAAAGNDGTTDPVYPAAFTRVISVAGLTKDLLPAPWASRGPWVKASTRAVGIRSTFVEGEESIEFDPQPDVFPPNPWAHWSGSSFAAAQITGAIARICQVNPAATPVQAWQMLSQTGYPYVDFGQVIEVLPA